MPCPWRPSPWPWRHPMRLSIACPLSCVRANEQVAATEAFGSKKAKVPTKVLKDCASKAPNVAAAAFLDKLPGWAENAPSPFLAGEALALLDTLAGRATEKHAAAAFTALAALARDERFRKADRARALLETAKALAKARVYYWLILQLKYDGYSF